MRPSPRGSCLHLAVACALSLVLPRPTMAQRMQLREVCDETTLITLVGVDTRARVALVAMASRRAEVPGWLLEVRAAGTEVVLHPDRQRDVRFGGSIGPSPVFAFLPCGDGCLQPEVWQEGSWRDLGAPIHPPTAAILHGTWDRDGGAWVAFRLPAAAPTQVNLQAFRLQGSAWLPRGASTARAVGSPGLRPDPEHGDAVVAGTVRFSALAPPATSALGLPEIPATERSMLLPLAGGAAAVLTAGSRLLVSSDRGATWREQVWTPWRPPGTDREYAAGADYRLDLPSGHDADLPLLWMDERAGSAGTAWLTTGVGSTRRALGQVPTSEPLELALHFADGSWLLVGGCRRDQRTAYLLTRGGTGPWQQVPLAAAW